MSSQTASLVDGGLSIVGSMGGIAVIRANRAPLLLSFTPSRSLTVAQERHLFSSAAKAYDQHLTQLSYSFSKHAGRHPETWGNLKGPMNTWHDQAFSHLKDIYNAPGKFKKITDPTNGLTWIEKRLPNGKGLRLNQDYTFKGFVD